MKESEDGAHCKYRTFHWMRSRFQILLSYSTILLFLHLSVISFLPFVSCKTLFITSTYSCINWKLLPDCLLLIFFLKSLRLLKHNRYYLNQLLPFSLKPVYTSGTQMCTLRTKRFGCPKFRIGYLGHKSM